jgi:hypothetical protein
MLRKPLILRKILIIFIYRFLVFMAVAQMTFILEVFTLCGKGFLWCFGVMCCLHLLSESGSRVFRSDWVEGVFLFVWSILQHSVITVATSHCKPASVSMSCYSYSAQYVLLQLWCPVCPVTATVPSISCYSYSAQYFLLQLQCPIQQ